MSKMPSQMFVNLCHQPIYDLDIIYITDVAIVSVTKLPQ